MALVNIVNCSVLNNPSAFLSPFQFEITFECIEDLHEDLEWKIIYVGSAESMDCDQTLETILVGPVPGGTHMFVFEAGPPNVRRIPDGDALGVTVVLLTCSYKHQEFIRVGYFVNNEYDDPELRENPPSVPAFDKIQRNILADKPRVTRFNITWKDGQEQVGGAVQSMNYESSQDSENMMPQYNTQSMSNQSSDSPPGKRFKSQKEFDEEDDDESSMDSLEKDNLSGIFKTFEREEKRKKKQLSME